MIARKRSSIVFIFFRIFIRYHAYASRVSSSIPGFHEFFKQRSVKRGIPIASTKCRSCAHHEGEESFQHSNGCIHARFDAIWIVPSAEFARLEIYF